MNFGTQIKNLRTSKNLTQEEMAQSLGISRQAVSNWENDRNLPDIEMLIIISQTFSISLDELILGGKDMNNMTEKLIKDTSENRRAKMNFASVLLGIVLFAIGIICLVLKANGDYVDTNSLLHESFYLIPLAFLFFAAGFIVFLSVGIKNIFYFAKTKEKKSVFYILVAAGVALLCVGLFLCLVASNSGANTATAGIALAVAGIALIIFSIIKNKN